jgi:hypothetical protein
MKEIRWILRRLLIVALFPVILFAAAPAQAGLAAFDSRAAFISAFPSAIVEGWDSTPFTDGYIITNGIPINGITYNSSYGDARVTADYLVSTEPNGLGQSLDGFFYPQDTITFSFSDPIRAFGIDINTYVTADGTFKAVTSQGEVLSVFDPFAYDEEETFVGQFVGFTSDVDIYWVTIASINPDPYSPYSYTVDTMRHTPLPPTLWLLGPGLAGLGLVRARRRFKP